MICIFVITPYQKQWEFLKNKFKAGNLGHAYLFSGNDTESIKNFTRELIKTISCSAPKKFCNECQNCMAVEKNNFPDLLFIDSANSDSSLKEGRDNIQIDIDQIRNLQKFLSYKPYISAYKFVIIERAERMNLQTQNCLLKTLEEPPQNSLIFLISQTPEVLLPTVFSRVQQIKFWQVNANKISKEQAGILGDLSKLIGAELAEKFIYSKNTQLDCGNFLKILQTFEMYFRSLLLSKIGMETDVFFNERGNYSITQVKKVLRLIEKVSYWHNFSNANPKLALEILLMELS